MSDQQSSFEPKYRIIGAVILVVLAVIIIPKLLREDVSPPPMTNTDDDTQIVVAPVDTGAELADAPITMPAPEQLAAPLPLNRPTLSSPAPSALVTPATPPVIVESAEPAKTAFVAKPTVAKSGPRPAAAASKGWVVQVGTFTNDINAARLEDKLRKSGHRVSRDRIVLAEGAKALRLRVGPFHDRSAALKAQTEIQRATGVQGLVRAYP